jgi:hypothetical protein
VLEAGVGDDRVEAAEALERRVDRGPVAVARREVRGERLARAALVGLQVDGEHPHAVVDQPLGDRLPDPAARARDERDPRLRTVHVQPLRIRVRRVAS